MQKAVEEIISDDEEALANELKQLCTCFGKERRESLADSSKVLQKLGILYLGKGKTSSDMLQKLAFIRSSALLHGAKYRFKLLEMHGDTAEIDRILEEFSQELLKASGSQKTSTNLAKISDEILKELDVLRSEVNQKVNAIRQVPECRDSAELLRAERDKTEVMRKLTEETTDNFNNLMKKIAGKCIDVLGPPPCKFAKVGLGSLARREITLYSDFEHVIVLEEGVQHLPNYDSILEYFRWYAVVFQVVIIGLGETFIRSVGVKSINDLNARDKSKNWFYDNVTPCGLAFDGMVPHSCNNPLGRQEATESRPHVVELIQPADAMANFLTSEQHLKNGYYLRDVLARTCMVYGDAAVHESFLSRSRAILSSEHMVDVAKEQSRSIEENVNFHVGKNILQGVDDGINLKCTVYRPVTALLAYLARVYKIFAASSFDIVAELSKLHIIGENARHNLDYSIALACEIRMKMYATVGHQRHDVEAGRLLDLIGKRSALDFSAIMAQLRENVVHIVKAWATGELTAAATAELKTSEFRTNNPQYHSQFLFNMGLYDDAMLLLEPLYTPTCRFMLALCYVRRALEDEAKRTAYFQKAAQVYSEELDMCENLSIEEKSIAFFGLGFIYVCLRRYPEALDCCETWFRERGMADGYREQYDAWLTEFRGLDMEVRSICMDKKLLIRYLKNSLRDEGNTPLLLRMKYALAEAQMEVQKFRSAKATLSELVQEIRLNAGKVREVDAVSLLRSIAEKQLIREWFKDALDTSDILRMIVDQHDMREEDILTTALALSSLERYEMCIDYLNKYADVQKASEEVIKILSDCYLQLIMHSKADTAANIHHADQIFGLSKLYQDSKLIDVSCSGALLFLLANAEQSEYLEVADCFKRAPERAQISDHARSGVCVFLDAQLRNIKRLVSTGAQSYAAKIVGDLFACFVDNNFPVINAYFYLSFLKENPQLCHAGEVEKLKRGIKRRCSDLGEGITPPTAYTLGVSELLSNNLKSSANLLWKTVVTSRELHVEAKATDLLLTLAVATMVSQSSGQLDTDGTFVFVGNE